MEIDKRKVDEFKYEIRTETVAYSKAESLANAEEEVYMDAIYLGYLDACRTFGNQRKIGRRDDEVEKLAEQLRNYINEENAKFEHAKYCDTLKEGYGMSFGQAQKIVNMAFKYLYCLTKEGDKVRERFDVCHMPLDGVMLEWIYKNIQLPNGKKLIKGKIGAWSAMEEGDETDVDSNGKYAYSFYQKILREYCKANEMTQLQLDFENWKKMSLIIAAKTFLKYFNNDKEAAKKWIDKV